MACLGHIEPQDGVLQVTAAYFEGRPQRVIELKVKQGDQVRAGELLAILDGEEELKTGRAPHGSARRSGPSATRSVKAGAPARPTLPLKRRSVSQLQAALENARGEYHRYEVLHQQTDVSNAELDDSEISPFTPAERKLRGSLRSGSQAFP